MKKKMVIMDEEKLKENMSQENILGGESLFNRVYQGITGLSNAVTSGFLSLKKTVSDISGNMKKMTRFEENQASTTLSLKAPKKCKVSDGSAYGQSKLTNAQVLEKLELVPVSLTILCECRLVWGRVQS